MGAWKALPSSRERRSCKLSTSLSDLNFGLERISWEESKSTSSTGRKLVIKIPLKDLLIRNQGLKIWKMRIAINDWRKSVRSRSL